MTSKAAPQNNDKYHNPLDEDELTPEEISRYGQGHSSCAGEILANFSLYHEDCRQQAAKQGNNHWAVPWSDLMMTMFILFVVLYAYQISLMPPIWGDAAGRDRASAIMGGEKIVSTATINDLSPPNGHALATIYDESRQVLNHEKLNSIATVDLVPDKSVRIVLTSDLLFADKSDFLSQQARWALVQIVPLLAMAPYQIKIVGHTDNRPMPAADNGSNWQLSMARALQVGQFLMDSGGLAQERFTIIGKAGTEPRVANDNAANRRLNRRVEIVLAERRADPHVNLVEPVKVVQ